MKPKEHIRFKVEFDRNPELEFVVTKFIVPSNASVMRIFRNLMAKHRSRGATSIRRLFEWDK